MHLNTFRDKLPTPFKFNYFLKLRMSSKLEVIVYLSV